MLQSFSVKLMFLFAIVSLGHEVPCKNAAKSACDATANIDNEPLISDSVDMLQTSMQMHKGKHLIRKAYQYPSSADHDSAVDGSAPVPTADPALLQEKLKVAYAVFVTDMKDATMKDVLAVQAYSLKQAVVKSLHDTEIVAIVPERFPEQDSEFLKKVGFAKVIRKPLPVQASEIDPVKGHEVHSQFQRTMSSGDHYTFSMAEETLKYWGLGMTEYDRVLVLDADVMVLDPMDELMERREDFVSTYDHGLDISGSTTPPVQGGFLLFKPNSTDFHELQKITREGDFTGLGWDKSGIGYAYGGTGPTGLLAYYFQKDAIALIKKKGKKNLQDGIYGEPTEGLRMFAADRSKYDVVISDRLNEDLKDVDLDKVIKGIKSIHFTGNCLKPWSCIRVDQGKVCDTLQARWWDLRAAFSKQSSSAIGCFQGKYQPLNL